jgi:hypothetical protein
VVDNYLGAGGGQHNALIYFPPGRKGVLIPWDLDFLDQSNAQASLTAALTLRNFSRTRFTSAPSTVTSSTF